MKAKNLNGSKLDNLVAAINDIKEKKNAVILAHYYQTPDIQDIADYVGDSLALSKKAEQTNADIIVMAGVHFMAETAKILNPNKMVLIPALNAGCSLAESCTPQKFREFILQYPDHTIISYINCSAEIKAMSDIICTSSNAETIIRNLPDDEQIIFAPDKNLGAYIEKITNRKLVKWDGLCTVHQEFSAEEVKRMKKQYPTMKVIAHPECNSYMLEKADFIGSTEKLLNYVDGNTSGVYLVATEEGLLHQLKMKYPHATFIPAPVISTCSACQQCPYMKMNNLENLYECLRTEKPEILVDEVIRQQAVHAIHRMFELS